MKKRILVVAQYFYPEQFRINDICKEWIKRGYGVTVLTGIPNYPQGKYYEGYGIFKKRKENLDGIEIIRIPLIPRGRNVIMLVLNYLSFVISGFFFVRFTKLKADIVFIHEVSPMTQALPGVWFAKRRKIPCILYVTDLWPENVQIVAGIRNKTIIDAIGRMVDYIYKHCNRILTSSKTFISSIEARGVSITKLEFWPHYAEDFYVPIPKDKAIVSEIPNDEWFNIIFAGNIGYAQGLDVLPETAKILKKSAVKARFNLVGDGRAKNALMQSVKINDVEEYFNFIDRRPAIEIPIFMSACDATLICLSKNKVFEMTLPTKLQSCMVCGVPIIVSADGELSEVVRSADAGICSPSGNGQKLAEAIMQMAQYPQKRLTEIRNNAIEYYTNHFDKKKLLDRIDEIFFKEIGGSL